MAEHAISNPYCLLVCFVYSARNKDQKLVGCFLKIWYFNRLLIQEIWLTKMDTDWPNAEIGQEMANDQLLFLALVYAHVCGRYVRACVCMHVCLHVYLCKYTHVGACVHTFNLRIRNILPTTQ